jgi:hypothetical protein
MNWAHGLILFATVFGAIGAAYAYLDARTDEFISNKDLNRERITPKFDVGQDAK